MPKNCNKCNELRDDSVFGKDVRNQDGLVGVCNLCKQAANKALREKRIKNNDYRAPAAKACSQCQVVKDPILFYKDKAMPDGLATVCKQCRKVKTYAWREANKDRYNKSQSAYMKAMDPEKRYGSEIKRRYGCTLEQYNEMLTAQGGACAVCKKLHNPAQKKGRLFVDHCHKTTKVRALLCGACNSMIGYAKDDTRILAEAIAYIVRHR